MDPRSIKDSDEKARASRLPDFSLLRGGLTLAGVFPFAMGEDGTLDVVNADALAIRLFAPSGSLSLSQTAWQARLSEEDQRARLKAIKTLSWDGARYQIDYPVQTDQGTQVHIREIAEAIAVADGRATLVHGVLMDRTEAAKSIKTAAWLARHDQETELPNEAALISRTRDLVALSHTFGAKAHLIRLRVTNFDSLSSIYGPELRAAILNAVRERLVNEIKQPDILARLKNGDWAVLTFGTDPNVLQDALGHALFVDPVRSRFGTLDLTVEAAHMKIGAELDSSVRALSRLEQTLDRATRTRPSSQGDEARSQVDVIKALADDRISLAFQPIVHADTGALAHHECLLRLRGHDGQIISAGPLVMQAEQDDLVDKLDQRALALAIPHLEAHPELHLALNVSAATVTDKDNAKRYLKALEDISPLAACLTIEMTETLAVDDPQQAADFAGAVKALGCRFSIDDFGAGYTTFRNLMAIDADSVKIDGSLIKGIATDKNKQTFMRMMVDLAQTVGVKTVAEMVETKADADILSRLGADYLQGFYFGHPSASPVWSRLGRRR